MPDQPGRVRWPKPKRCQADTGGKHRWEYAKDRTGRECQKCGTVSAPASTLTGGSTPEPDSAMHAKGDPRTVEAGGE
jgi:hypothetical protein